MKKIVGLVSCLLFITVMLMPKLLLAQPGFGDDVNDSGAPLDGGLSILAASGIGYGIKKIKDARKKKMLDADTNMEK